MIGNWHQVLNMNARMTLQLFTLYVVILRRGNDGTDLLFIPFPSDTLEHIMAEMEAVE